MANLATINNNLLADSGIDPLSVVLGTGTANQIAYWVDADNVGALTTATYPSLTELSYVKGVTSAIQTQLNGKQPTGNYVTLDTAQTITALKTISFANAGGYVLDIRNSSATGYGIKIRSGADTYEAIRISNAADTADNIKLYGSGNATFVGDVTVNKIIKSGGTAAQILAADGTVITAGTNITISGGSISAADIGFANPMTTLGDIIYGAASGTATRLAGNTTTTKQYLSQTGNGTASAAPTWATIAGSDITGAALTKTDDTNVTLTLGGTPATALLRAASLTLGWTGQLSVARGGTGASTAVAAFDNLSPLTTLGDTLYHNGTDNVRLAGNTTTTKQYLSQTGTGTVSAAPSWATIAGSDITGAALTKTDDTNVTLTLGGTPSTALLRAVSLTLGWTGQLSVARGGTGAASFTAGQILYGNGTSAIASSATFTYTPTSALLVNNSVTAASAIARGVNITSTLVAAANNDVLVGLDIAPTYTNGAFTGVTNTALRVQGTTTLTGALSGTSAIFSSTVSVTNSGVDGTFADAFIARYSGNTVETNAIQTSVSVQAQNSGFRFEVSNGGGSSARTDVLDLLRDRAVFYNNVGIRQTSPNNFLHITGNNGTVGGTQITLEDNANGYGAGFNAASRTSAGGTLVQMGKVVFDGEGLWNTTASTQDAYYSVWVAENGSLIQRQVIRSDGNVYFGNGITSATPLIATLRATNGTGTNIAGAEFRIVGGVGTGTGAGGAITFYTAAAGTSGSTLNTAAEKFRIAADGTVRMNQYTTNGIVYTSGANGTLNSAARTFTIGATGKTFDGSGNLSWSLAEIGAQAALTNPITGDGTEAAGNISYFTGNTSIAGNASLFWDTTNSRLGVGTNSPNLSLDVRGNTTLGGGATATSLQHTIDGNARYLMVSGSGANANYGFVWVVNNVAETTNATMGGYAFGQLVASKTGTNAGTKALISGVTSGSGGTVGGFGGEMRFYTRPDNAANDIGSYERMRINSAGAITMYGALSGTSATFSGIIATSGTGLNASVRIANTTATTGVDWHLYSLNNGNFGIYNNTAGAYALQISSTGAATFSSSVTASGNLNLQGAVTRNINFYDSSNTNINAQIQYDQISANSGQLFFGTNNAGTFATRLTISNTGAATFGSSVTAGSTIFATNSGVDGTFADAFVGRYSGNNNEQNAIQTAVSSAAGGSGFRFMVSNGGGSSGRTNTVDFVRNNSIFYTTVQIPSNTWIQSNNIGLVRDSYFGYSTGYRTVQIGGGSVALGVDLTGNASGNFTGNEIVIPNNRGIIAPNNANNNYLGVLRVTSADGIRIGGDYTVSGWINILSSGNVGVGESNPTSRLVVRKDAAGARGGEISIVNYAASTLNSSAALNFGLEASTYDADNGNAQIKAQITTAANSASDLIFSTWNGTAFGERFRIASGGAATFSSSVTATSFFESSDIRLKSNVQDYIDYDVLNIGAKIYEKDGKIEVGYIAQDVEKIVKSAVAVRDNDMLDLSYRQVHTAKIAALEAKIKQLEEQLKNK